MLRAPRFGEPARVAFVGQESVHGKAALHAPTASVLPRFFEHRPPSPTPSPGDDAAGDPSADLAAALARWAPHVVVVFAPHALPAEALAPAVTLAVLDDAVQAPPGYQRAIATDPAASAWRTMPPPVDDRIYAPVGRAGRPPRALFLGESTPRRERFLIGPKHEYDLLHYAHGLHGDDLAAVLARTDVGVNLRDVYRDGFEHAALVHLAAGQLLISEPLRPTFGLEPGTDYVEIERPDELLTVLYQLEGRADTYERTRILGRQKADSFRASVVWPRVIADLLAEELAP